LKKTDHGEDQGGGSRRGNVKKGKDKKNWGSGGGCRGVCVWQGGGREKLLAYPAPDRLF